MGKNGAAEFTATLNLWRESAQAEGFATPDPQRLAEIARDALAWQKSSISPVEASWSATINHLLTQSALGVLPDVAVAHLPASLHTPPGAPRAASNEAQRGVDPGPERPGGQGSHAGKGTNAEKLDALVRWRASQIAAGVEGADSIRDVTLRNLVRHNMVGVDQIRGQLAGSAVDLASSIAEVLAGFESATGTGTTASGPTTPAPAPTPAAETPAAHSPSAQTPPVPPLPAHATTPSPAGSVPSQRQWTHADFCTFDYPDTEIEPSRITTAPRGEVGVTLSWQPWDGPEPCALYRVVSSEDEAPYKPESGELLDVTTEPTLVDERFLTSSVRVYQVWCHAGNDEISARNAQPVKWASGEEVSPVDKMRLSEEAGCVIGEWEVFTGTRSVRVFRIPLEGPGPRSANPSNQICTDQPNLAGFVDQDVPRGKRFLYSVQAEVLVESSVRLSRAVKKDILVSVDMIPVSDLAVTMNESATSFQMTWTTPPGGQQVRVHRFSSPPPSGMENEVHDESALTVAGFTDETRIKNPVIALDETTSQISGVPWPADWDRAYLTPVTSAGGRARIGTTRVQTRPLPAVAHARIVERFTTQLITFGWPTGAAEVHVYVGSALLDPVQLCAEERPFAEVTAGDHRRDGAIILPQPLPANGCIVCLVPVAYSGGQQFRGDIAILNYDGLSRVWYFLEPLPPTEPTSRVVRLRLDSSVEIATPPALVLVGNPERLPLDSHDGVPLQFTVRGQQLPHCVLDRIPQGHTPTEFTVDLSNVYGFVRLFVQDDFGRLPQVALHDPHPAELVYSPLAPTGGHS